MTTAQKANVARFKAVQAEAKKLKAKNKNLTHLQAVKQAWAIMLHKKPAAKKKAAKKVGAVKKKVAKKKPTEKAILKKVHSAKTTSKTLFNKLDKLDEAQHAHMSGNITNFSLLQISRNNESAQRLEKVLLQNKEKMKLFPYKTTFWQNYFKKKNKEISDYIKTLKKQNTTLKKHIK